VFIGVVEFLMALMFKAIEAFFMGLSLLTLVIGYERGISS
jgi:hypothetical protein